MQHAKLITAGILLLTFLFVNELQQTFLSKIESAGDKIRQTELVALLWNDGEEDGVWEDNPEDLRDRYPQASALSIIEKVAFKLIYVTKQEIIKLR